MVPGAQAPVELLSARDGAAPSGVSPLPLDLFRSRDFCADRALNRMQPINTSSLRRAALHPDHLPDQRCAMSRPKDDESLFDLSK